jgi:hypothetical protein
MSPYERHQTLAALMLLVVALFVSSGFPPAARWRRPLQIGTIVLFAIALTLVLVEIGLWLGGCRE